NFQRCRIRGARRCGFHCRRSTRGDRGARALRRRVERWQHALPVLDVTAAGVATTQPYLSRARMTLTYPVLNRPRQIIWLVTGSERQRCFAGSRTEIGLFRLEGFAAIRL